MNLEVAGVAERLVQEFPEHPATVVIQAVCEFAEACGSAGPFFIEQAVRARLAADREHEHHQATSPVVIPPQPQGAEDQFSATPAQAVELGVVPAQAVDLGVAPGPVLDADRSLPAP